MTKPASGGASQSRYSTYEHDAAGSVIGLEDGSGSFDDPARPGGEAEDLYHYDPYGELMDPDPGNATADVEAELGDAARENPFRFQGFYYDSGIESYDMQARQYRPRRRPLPQPGSLPGRGRGPRPAVGRPDAEPLPVRRRQPGLEHRVGRAPWLLRWFLLRQHPCLSARRIQKGRTAQKHRRGRRQWRWRNPGIRRSYGTRRPWIYWPRSAGCRARRWSSTAYEVDRGGPVAATLLPHERSASVYA